MPAARYTKSDSAVAEPRHEAGFGRSRHRVLSLSKFFAALSCLVLVLAGCKGKDDAGTDDRDRPRVFPVEHLGTFHQANGFIEMDQYQRAAELLKPMVAESGGDPAVRANLALAVAGLQRLERAEKLARQAAKDAPRRSDIAEIVSAVLSAQGRHDEATIVLRKAVALDPRSATAHWAWHRALRAARTGRDDAEQRDTLEALIKLVPKNIVALLETAKTNARVGDVSRTEALLHRAIAIIQDVPEVLAPYIETFEQAQTHDLAQLLRLATLLQNVMRPSNRYRADGLDLGMAADGLPNPIAHPIHPLSDESRKAVRAKIRFEDRTDELGLASVAADTATRKIVLGTYTDDRAPALYVVRDQRPGLLLGREAGRFVDVTQTAGLSNVPPCRDVLFIDINNDARMDMVFSGLVRDAVYLNTPGGRFVDASAQCGLSLGGPSLGAVGFDFDNDGDLDLLRWDATTLHFHRNDGEGGLTQLARVPGLPSSQVGIRSVLPLDVDDDGDIDLCVITGAGPYQMRIYSDERLGRFTDVSDRIGANLLRFVAEPLVGDFDNDGWLEFVDVATGRVLELGADFRVEEGTIGSPPGLRPASATALDADRDGMLDIIQIHADGRTNQPGVEVKPGDGLVAVDLDGDGAVDLLSSSGRAFLNRTENAGHWLNVSLKAIVKGDSRFNAFGIGSTIELRAGDLYQKRTAQSPTTHFGLGPYTHADVLRIVWPNGSYQNLEYRATATMNLAADTTVVAEQNLKGSCPYLYTWNGERFEFATDVLWRSGLGMAIMADVFAHHGTADDYFKIAGDSLKPTGGRYVLQFTEELWETAYFDYCRLFVVDHPVDTQIYVDERCLSPPYPSFRIYSVSQPRRVIRATDERGRDLTDLIARADRRYIAGFEKTRYQGLVNQHDLILDFGTFDVDEEFILYLTGWLWPTDASTNIAASQNPTLEAIPPVLSVLDASGQWRIVDMPIGFPSGKNKTMVLDLTGVFGPTARKPRTDDAPPEGEGISGHCVKLSTNFAIYWDHVFFTVGPQEAATTVTELSVDTAHLHYRGFSHEYQRVRHGPAVPQYDTLDELRHWRGLVGSYTRYGDVSTLLSTQDSMYAIVGAGDEVTLHFDASAVPPLPKGWRRDFVIHTDGWLKDGDLNSATGKTVEPLPFHGMSAYPYPAGEHYPTAPRYREYRDTYNTRRMSQTLFRERLRRQVR